MHLSDAEQANATGRTPGRLHPSSNTNSTGERMTFVSALPTAAPAMSGQAAKTLRQRGADNFHAALAAVLTAGLDDALKADDHPKAITFINRGFAEGSPQLGCDLLCRAMTVVGVARTWTVQLAPLTRVPQRSAPTRDAASG